MASNSEKIDLKTLRHLAQLSRIELKTEEEETLLADMQKILAFVEDLNETDTKGASPMNGGGDLRNVFREDEEREGTYQGAGKEAFPGSKDGYLSVPPVLKHKENEK